MANIASVTGFGWTRTSVNFSGTWYGNEQVWLVNGDWPDSAVVTSVGYFDGWDGFTVTLPLSLVGDYDWFDIGLLNSADTTTPVSPPATPMTGVTGFHGVRLDVTGTPTVYPMVAGTKGTGYAFDARTPDYDTFWPYELSFTASSSDMVIALKVNGSSVTSWTVAAPSWSSFRVSLGAYSSDNYGVFQMEDTVTWTGATTTFNEAVALSGGGVGSGTFSSYLQPGRVILTGNGGVGSGTVSLSTITFDHTLTLAGAGVGTGDVTSTTTLTPLSLAGGGSGSGWLQVPRSYAIDASTGRPQYRCELLDAATGTPLGELESALLDPISESVNGVATWGFSVAATDPKAGLVRPNLTEVRAWRGGQIIFWGPIIRSTTDGISLKVQAADSKWYFSRRTIGLIPTANLLTNGDFEQGEVGWDFKWIPGSLPACPPTHAITNDALTGSHSLSIEGAASTTVITTGLLSTALFYPNSSTLLPGADAAIIEVAETLVAGEAVTVVGHTANDGTGSGLSLSKARADVVAAILAANSAASPIIATGVGFYDPDPEYAVDAPEQRRVTISGTATIEAKGNKQYAGQSFLYTNPSARSMPLTLVGWFKVLTWTEAGIGYGVDLELVDPTAEPEPLTGLFDKDSAILTGSALEAVKQLAYRFNAGPIEVIGHAAVGESDAPGSLSIARAEAVARVIAANSTVGPITATGVGTTEPIPGSKVTSSDQQGCTFTGVVDKTITAATVAMDKYTAKNAWIRQEATIEVPADGHEYRVDVKLHPPQGTVLWDSVAVRPGIVSAWYDADQATIFAGLVALAQDVSLGKSNLNIGAQCPQTGIIRTREYAWSDRKPVSEALAEFPTLADGMDWDVLYSPTQRWVQTWHPRRGRDSGYVLAYGSNLTSWTLDHDGEQTGSVIVVQSASASGPGREEGYVRNASTLDGIILERVYQAPVESSIGTLDAQAAEGWARYSKPVLIPRVLCHPGFTTELLNAVELGDVVRLVLPDIDGTFRVTARQLDPTNDQLSLQLSEE